MKFITAAAILSCDHKTGTVMNIPSQQFVTVNGAPILVGNDPMLKPIGGCPNAGPTIKPCTLTLTVEAGKSKLVFINGKPACMDTISGGTDGTPPMVTKYSVTFSGQILVDTDT